MLLLWQEVWTGFAAGRRRSREPGAPPAAFLFMEKPLTLLYSFPGRWGSLVQPPWAASAGASMDMGTGMRSRRNLRLHVGWEHTG